MTAEWQLNDSWTTAEQKILQLDKSSYDQVC
jgi:hypothetical protein